MFFHKSDVLLKKKSPGRAAPHRSPDWGCTKTPISNGNPSKNPEIGFWRSAAEAAACKCAAAGLSPAFRGVPDHSSALPNVMKNTDHA